MASKGINNENLNLRDQRAAETRRAKKQAKAAALGKGGSKKAQVATFDMFSVIEDKKNKPLNRLNRELEKQGETRTFAQKAHLICREYIAAEKLPEQEKHQNRMFLMLGCDFKGDFNFEKKLGLEQIQNEWPTLKVWAFGAKYGDCFDHGKHFPSVLKGEPAWLTIGRIA